MTPEDALAQIAEHADPQRAEGARAYHKADRPYLGVPNPVLNDLTRAWRADLDADGRVSLARDLWQTNIYEARIAAAKLLTTARIRPDDSAAWALIASWTPDFDSWAIADHACMAGQKRLQEDPLRVDQVAEWTRSEHMWTRRAALVITLPWAKQNFPKPQDLEIRDRVLGWAASYVPDRDWFIQKAIAWWVRDLSKHDRPRAEAFLAAYGDAMKPFARKEAGKYL
ncbi:DNA alkylation repair protein [Aliishimia ponticola]|uniref:DNA alkylation repair protein n=1 Tax=Aliishimia ponticola TaxID=2499833 RepID=A0A4S4NKW7_9RHOB|nr:DNA alkylation repair protein [Aliishimia ponticola]THH38938.1 DNA alkylation repair protein [Aliishimia ponticola]